MGKIATTQTVFFLMIPCVVGQVSGCVFNSGPVEQLKKRSLSFLMCFTSKNTNGCIRLFIMWSTRISIFHK